MYISRSQSPQVLRPIIGIESQVLSPGLKPLVLDNNTAELLKIDCDIRPIYH